MKGLWFTVLWALLLEHAQQQHSNAPVHYFLDEDLEKNTETAWVPGKVHMLSGPF
jgi:hypothetical protein